MSHVVIESNVSSMPAAAAASIKSNLLEMEIPPLESALLSPKDHPSSITSDAVLSISASLLPLEPILSAAPSIVAGSDASINDSLPPPLTQTTAESASDLGSNESLVTTSTAAAVATSSTVPSSSPVTDEIDLTSDDADVIMSSPPSASVGTDAIRRRKRRYRPPSPHDPDCFELIDLSDETKEYEPPKRIRQKTVAQSIEPFPIASSVGFLSPADSTASSTSIIRAAPAYTAAADSSGLSASSIASLPRPIAPIVRPSLSVTPTPSPAPAPVPASSPPVIVEVEKQLSCRICLDKYTEPVTTTCGHIFCTACIKQWIEVKKSCPDCRKKLTKSSKLIRIYI